MSTGPSPTLIIDFGAANAAAIVASEPGAWLVPDPVSGAARWPCALHGDGQQIVAGLAAQQRGQVDPAGYVTELRRILTQDGPVVLGGRRLRPVELVAEYFAALRDAAGRLLAAVGAHHASPQRAVLTIPASAGPGTSAHLDSLRGRLVGAAEAAGFGAVELLDQAAGAVWAPGSPLRVGEVAVVCDLGATVEATVVRVGHDLPEILGYASVDWPGASAREAAEPPLEAIVASCRELLGRSGVDATQVSWVLPVGDRARAPGLGPLLQQHLGIAVAIVDEPELAVIRGAAVCLARSGPRSVMARVSGQRVVPLTYTIPGGSAQLVRWLVEPQQPYDAGATMARVRLSGGALWDLTARTSGTVDEVLVPGGREVRSGEWLALVRPR